MVNFVSHKKITLLSRSPRRRRLLADMGFVFDVASPNADELIPPGLTPIEAAIHLSQLKADSAKSMLSDDNILISADTVVFANNKILGKPKNRQEALQMLHMLSGNSHTVVTGVTLRTLEKSVSFAETTEVFFRKLDTDDIEHYVDTWQPFDKAGSYGIQEWIGLIGVEKIIGCHYNVMGLPTSRLYEELKKFDVFPC